MKRQPPIQRQRRCEINWTIFSQASLFLFGSTIIESNIKALKGNQLLLSVWCSGKMGTIRVELLSFVFFPNLCNTISFEQIIRPNSANLLLFGSYSDQRLITD